MSARRLPRNRPNLRPLARSATFAALLVAVMSIVTPPKNFANPLGSDSSYKRLGWWDPARTMSGGPAIHTVILRGANSNSEVLYWGEQDSTVRMWRWNPGDTLCACGGDAIYSKPTGRSTNEMFCAGHSALPDGRSLIVGGTEISPFGIKDVNTFNYATEGWVSPVLSSMEYGRWYPTSTSLPDGSHLVTSGEMFPQMYTFGGADSAGIRGEIASVLGMRRPLVAGDSTAIGTRPLPREGASMIFDESDLSLVSGFRAQYRGVLYGGRDADSTWRDVWGLYLQANTNVFYWRKLWTATDTFPDPRSFHSAVYNPGDSTMVVFGGRRADGSATNDTWKLYLAAPDSGKWKKIAVGDSIPPARYGHSAILNDGSSPKTLVVYGGTNGSEYFRDVWKLTLSGTPTWTRLAPSGTGPTARRGHSAIFANSSGRMIVFGGGRTDSLFNDTWQLDLSLNAWSLVPGTGPSPRMGHTSLPTRDGRWGPRMAVIGGDTNGATAGGKSKEVWTLRLDDLSATFWSDYTSTVGMSVGRSDMAGASDPRWLFAVNPEKFTPSGGGGSWSTLRWGARLQPYYPFMFVLPSGKLFYGGPSDSNYVFDMSDTSDPWKTYSWSPTSFRGGSAAMFLPGKVLKTGSRIQGGADSHQSYWIDMSGSPDTAQWRSGGNMVRPRGEPNLTILPTGQVLVTGGYVSNENKPARRPQLWNPNKTSWSDSLAEEPVNRGYHASAVLLPDGRVFSAGGIVTLANSYKGTIYYPPYLFTKAGKLASRPFVDDAASNISYGDSFTVCMPSVPSLAKVCLIKPGACTHSFDEDQRFIPLGFTASCTRLRVAEPLNANIAPPGDYLLFVVKSDSVPSVATWVRVGDTRDESQPICLQCGGGFGMIASLGEESASWSDQGNLLRVGTNADRVRINATKASASPIEIRLKAQDGAAVRLDGVRLRSVVLDPGEEYLGAGFAARARPEWANVKSPPTEAVELDLGSGVAAGTGVVTAQWAPRTAGAPAPFRIEYLASDGEWAEADLEAISPNLARCEIPSARARVLPDRGGVLTFIGGDVRRVGENMDAVASPVERLHSRRGVLEPSDPTTSLSDGEDVRLRFDPLADNARALFLEVDGLATQSGTPSSPGAGEPHWQNALGPILPNPAYRRATIRLTLAAKADLRLRIYNAAGRLVRTLVRTTVDVGPHDFIWDGRNDAGARVASGVYFCRATAPGWEAEGRLVLVGH